MELPGPLRVREFRDYRIEVSCNEHYRPDRMRIPEKRIMKIQKRMQYDNEQGKDKIFLSAKKDW